MATVKVYKDEVLVDYKEFDTQFIILQDINDSIIWQTYEERKHAKKGELAGGKVQIWMQMIGSPNARIHTIEADWGLIIDGELVSEKQKDDILIAGRQVELNYKNLRFLFLVNIVH